MNNSVQTGFEYDTNVFKTFDNSTGDFLFRSLLKLSPTLQWPDASLTSTYRLGGKIFFTKSEQNLVINEFESALDKNFSDKFAIAPSFNVKYQLENSKTDALGLDINETFLEVSPTLALKWFVGKGLKISPYGEFTLLKFDSPYPQYGFLRSKYGLLVTKSLSKLSEGGFSHSYYGYHFNSSSRNDSLNETSVFLKYSGPIFLSLSFAFQTNHSNIGALSFSNYKATLISSLPIKFAGGIKAGTGLDPDLIISLIAIFQFKHYPSTSGIDSEGQRFLLSESEEDNFNIIILKITKNFTGHFGAEFKYTRHSSGFSSSGEHYGRSEFYLGGLYNF